MPFEIDASLTIIALCAIVIAVCSLITLVRQL